MKDDLLLPDKLTTNEPKLPQTKTEKDQILHFPVMRESLLDVTKEQDGPTSTNKGVFHQVFFLLK